MAPVAVPHDLDFHMPVMIGAGSRTTTLALPVRPCGAARQRRLEKLRALRNTPRPVYAEPDDTTSSDEDGSADGSTPPHRSAPPRTSASQVKLSKEEEKRRKLEARKIRNRESAALSRKRKADLIADLEARVALLEKENSRLRCRLAAVGDDMPHGDALTSEGVAQRTNIYKPAAFVSF